MAFESLFLYRTYQTTESKCSLSVRRPKQQVCLACVALERIKELTKCRKNICFNLYNLKSLFGTLQIISPMLYTDLPTSLHKLARRNTKLGLPTNRIRKVTFNTPYDKFHFHIQSCCTSHPSIEYVSIEVSYQ